MEIILFLGTARANEANLHGYPPGEKHALLVFLRQEKGSVPNWSKATTALEQKGWSDIALSEPRPIATEALGSVHPDALASYEDAIEEGFAVLVFSEAI